MNNSTFSLLIGMITCFLDGPLVVIWILGFGLDNPLTMLLIWSIFSTLRVGNVFLILRTSAVLTVGFEAWAYDLLGFDLSLDLSFEGLLFLKYFEIVLTSLAILAGSGGEGGTLSIEVGTGLGTILLVFVFEEGVIFGVNFVEIFSLSVMVLLLVCKESQLDW